MFYLVFQDLSALVHQQVATMDEQAVMIDKQSAMLHQQTVMIEEQSVKIQQLKDEKDREIKVRWTLP